jgi:hypothetical protein
MTKTNTDHLTFTELRKRGWTPRLIKQFLPEPDKLAINPHHRTGPKVRLYLLSRIEQAESLSEYQTQLSIAQRRSNAGKNLAARKAGELLAAVEAVTIAVKRIDLDELRRAAIEHWEDRKRERGCYDADGRDADESTIRRWMVNYVRHCLTNYDPMVNGLVGQVGRAAAYDMLKDRTIEKIEWIYPELTQ